MVLMMKKVLYLCFTGGPGVQILVHSVSKLIKGRLVNEWIVHYEYIIIFRLQRSASKNNFNKQPKNIQIKMDKSFTRFKQTLKHPESLVQSSTNIRCRTEQSQNKTLTIKNTVPQLLCENDELRDEIEKLRNQLNMKNDQLEKERRETWRMKKTQDLLGQRIGAYKERKSEGEDTSVKNRIRIFENAMKDLTFQRNTFPIQSQQSSSTPHFLHRFDTAHQNSSIPKKSVSLHKSHFSSRHSTRHLQNSGSQKFYQFCKNQILKTKNENSNLYTQIKDLRQQMLHIELQNKRLSNKCVQNELKIEQLRKQNKKIEEDGAEKDLLIETQRKVLEEEKTLYLEERSKIRQQQIVKKNAPDFEKQYSYVIQELEECKRKLADYMQLKDANYKLRNQVAELTVKSTQLFQKCYRFGPAINHLWQIKNIEYANMHKILSDCQTHNQTD